MDQSRNGAVMNAAPQFIHVLKQNEKSSFIYLLPTGHGAFDKNRITVMDSACHVTTNYQW